MHVFTALTDEYILLADVHLSDPGAFIPQGQWCISPYFRFPPSFRVFPSGKFFPLLPQKIWFHPPKLLVIDSKLIISPYFPNNEILPIYKISYSPYFLPFFPDFVKFTPFLHTLRVFLPPSLTMMHLCIMQCTYWTPLFGPITNMRPFIILAWINSSGLHWHANLRRGLCYVYLWLKMRHINL